MRNLILVFVFLLVGCGRPVDSTPQALDPNRCPTGEYGLNIETLNFASNGNLIFENGVCSASGTYSCDSATKTVSFTITDQENVPAWYLPECQGIGSFSCDYYYEQDAGYGYTNLLIKCSGDATNHLSSWTDFDTTSWDR